jgi:hypothetical protein
MERIFSSDWFFERITSSRSRNVHLGASFKLASPHTERRRDVMLCLRVGLGRTVLCRRVAVFSFFFSSPLFWDCFFRSHFCAFSALSSSNRPDITPVLPFLLSSETPVLPFPLGGGHDPDVRCSLCRQKLAFSERAL